MALKQIILTILILGTIAFFTWSILRIFRFVRLGKPYYDPVENFGWRIGSVLKYFFGQKSVVRELSGWGHFFIFWGFIILGLATIEMFTRGYNPTFHWGKIFGHGFEVFISTCFDFLGLAVMIAIVIAVIRRYIIQPERLRKDFAARFDAGLILTMIFTLMVSMFFTH